MTTIALTFALTLLPSPRNSKTNHLAILERTECTKVFFAKEVAPVVAGICAGEATLQKWQIPDFDDMRSESSHYPYSKTWETALHDKVVIVHTSGSTGESCRDRPFLEPSSKLTKIQVHPSQSPTAISSYPCLTRTASCPGKMAGPLVVSISTEARAISSLPFLFFTWPGWPAAWRLYGMIARLFCHPLGYRLRENSSWMSWLPLVWRPCFVRLRLLRIWFAIILMNLSSLLARSRLWCLEEVGATGFRALMGHTDRYRSSCPCSRQFTGRKSASRPRDRML